MSAILQQLDNFYLTEEDLDNSPSRKDGVDAETEKRLRFYGCQRIQRAVVLLGVPQVVAATAQTLLHRFYCKRSLRSWHIRYLTVAVTWIAIKIEEQTQLATLTEVAMVFHLLHMREDGDVARVENPENEAFIKMKSEITSKYEMGVFQALGFICHVDHPHKLTANLPGLIFYNSETKNPEIPEGLLQLATRDLDDSLNSRRLRISMPEDPPWWKFANTSFADIVTICKEIMSVHELPPPVYISVNKGETAASVDEKRAQRSVSKSPLVHSTGEEANGDAKPDALNQESPKDLPGPPAAVADSIGAPPPPSPLKVNDPVDGSDQSPSRTPKGGNRTRHRSRYGHNHSSREDRRDREDRRHRGDSYREERSRKDRESPWRSRKMRPRERSDRDWHSSHSDSGRKGGYRDRDRDKDQHDASRDDSSPRGWRNGSDAGERSNTRGHSGVSSGAKVEAKTPLVRSYDRDTHSETDGRARERRLKDSESSRRVRSDSGKIHVKGEVGRSRHDDLNNDSGKEALGVETAGKSSHKPLVWDEMAPVSRDRDASSKSHKRSSSGDGAPGRAPKIHRPINPAAE